MRESNRETVFKSRNTLRHAALLGAGLAGGLLISQGFANVPAPTEHKAIEVEALGAIDAASMASQLNLDGHRLQLREITILPGGQIAKHSHESRPGLVKMVRGSWVEGRPSGEITYSPGDEVILEDSETVHWFFNRGDEPATAYVCDIVPEG